MGGTKNRDEKRAAAKVFSSGGGGGTKGPSVIDKRNQELKCPHCDRIFKQQDRLSQHILKQHAAPVVETPAPEAPSAPSTSSISQQSAPSTSKQQPKEIKIMDIGSKAGAYDYKSPRLILHEMLLRDKSPKPRYKTILCNNDPSSNIAASSNTIASLWRCKVVLPHPKQADKDVVLFLDEKFAAEDENEAQQRAGVLALHHLAGNRSLELTLPPQYRPLWKYLGQKATEKATRDAAAEERRATQKAKQQAALKRKGPSAVVMTEDKRKLIENIISQIRQDHEDDWHLDTEGHDDLDGWNSMDTRISRKPGSDLIESRGAGVENAKRNNSNSSSTNKNNNSSSFLQSDANHASALIEDIMVLGFNRDDATHAVHAVISKNPSKDPDLSSALDWLCLNIDEKLLPSSFAPGAAGKPIEILHKASSTLVDRYKPRRDPSRDVSGYAVDGDVDDDTSDPGTRELMRYGYPRSVSQRALQEKKGCVHDALHWLNHQLCNCGDAIAAPLDGENVWVEERTALKAIYEDEARFWSPSWTQVNVHCSIQSKQAAERIALYCLSQKTPFLHTMDRTQEMDAVTDSVLADGLVLQLHVFDAGQHEMNNAKEVQYPIIVPTLALCTPPTAAVSANPRSGSSGGGSSSVIQHQVPLESLLSLTYTVRCKAIQQYTGHPMIYEIVTAIQEHLEDSIVTPMSLQEIFKESEALLPMATSSHTKTAREKSSAGDDDDDMSLLTTAMKDACSVSSSSRQEPATAQQQHRHDGNGRKRQPTLDVEKENKKLLEHHGSLASDTKHAAIRAQRGKLPAATQRHEVIRAVCSSPVVVVSGATGCGKSTQIPQYILENFIEQSCGATCNIICTQPRRISAVGLAQRVAVERGEDVGESVGYSVRLDTKQSMRTRLLFCTTGILLRKLLADPFLKGTTHVILDEVHERSIESDLLLLLLRSLLVSGRNKSLKIVLMSATANAELFASYFASHLVEGKKEVSILSIPGFTHPVKDFFLEDVLEHTGFVVGKSSRWAKKKAGKGVSLRACNQNQHQHNNDDDGDDDQDMDDFDNDEDSGRDVDNRNSAANTKSYSAQTRASLSYIDESLINYDLIESLIAYIISSKDNHANVAPPAAAAAAAAAAAVNMKNGNSMSPPSAILVFAPGAEDIDKITRTLESSRKIQEALSLPQSMHRRIRALPLHGGLPPAHQSRVFERPPPGTLKVVVSTNVAETSITIDDIVCVIDTGRAKEMRFDPGRGISRLQEAWISRASAQQRRGRAGRVQPGECYRLCSRETWSKVMPAETAPEVQRASLQGLVMDAKGVLDGAIVGVNDADRIERSGVSGASLGINNDHSKHASKSLSSKSPGNVASNTAAQALGEMITRPDPSALNQAIVSLQRIGALDPETESLTPLGRHLTRMPCDPRLGKMLIFGAMLRCMDPILTIAAAQSYGRSPFLSPHDARSEAEMAKASITSGIGASKSDHLAVVQAFNTWRSILAENGKSAASRFCTQNFLSEQAMDFIYSGRKQYVDILADLGFVSVNYARECINAVYNPIDNGVKSYGADQFSNNARIVKAALAAGLYPQLLRVEHPAAKFQKIMGGAVETDGEASQVKFYDREKGRVFLHPSSINFRVGKFESGWLVYGDIVHTSKVFVRESSMVPVYAVLLFGGELSVHHERGLVRVDGWATFKAPARIAVLVRELRSEVALLLERKVGDPGLDISGSKVVEALHHVLSTDGF